MTNKRKDPAAVKLGRRGGKKGGLAKVRKGFAAMPAAEAKRIRALAAEARRKKYHDAPGIYGAGLRGGACGAPLLSIGSLQYQESPGVWKTLTAGVDFTVEKITPEPSLSEPFTMTVKAHRMKED